MAGPSTPARHATIVVEVPVVPTPAPAGSSTASSLPVPSRLPAPRASGSRRSERNAAKRKRGPSDSEDVDTATGSQLPLPTKSHSSSSLARSKRSLPLPNATPAAVTGTLPEKRRRISRSGARSQSQLPKRDHPPPPNPLSSPPPKSPPRYSSSPAQISAAALDRITSMVLSRVEQQIQAFQQGAMDLVHQWMDSQERRIEQALEGLALQSQRGKTPPPVIPPEADCIQTIEQISTSPPEQTDVVILDNSPTPRNTASVSIESVISPLPMRFQSQLQTQAESTVSSPRAVAASPTVPSPSNLVDLAENTDSPSLQSCAVAADSLSSPRQLPSKFSKSPASPVSVIPQSGQQQQQQEEKQRHQPSHLFGAAFNSASNTGFGAVASLFGSLPHSSTWVAPDWGTAKAPSPKHHQQSVSPGKDRVSPNIPASMQSPAGDK